jgi:hypothetical protein
MLSSFTPELVGLDRHPNNNKLSAKPSSFCRVGKDLKLIKRDNLANLVGSDSS